MHNLGENAVYSESSDMYQALGVKKTTIQEHLLTYFFSVYEEVLLHFWRYCSFWNEGRDGMNNLQQISPVVQQTGYMTLSAL